MLEEKEVFILGICKVIVKNLKEVLELLVYCLLVLKVDVINFWNLCVKVKDKVFVEYNVKLIFLLWIVKVFVIVLSEYLFFVVRWDGVEGKVYYLGILNIGIVVDIFFGLFVFVIRGVENLSIIDI